MHPHEWDDDCVCIHCGLDGCDFPAGDDLPPCPVQDEQKREQNRKDYQEFNN
jgi:hypothetical protein